MCDAAPACSGFLEVEEALASVSLAAPTSPGAAAFDPDADLEFELDEEEEEDELEEAEEAEWIATQPEVAPPALAALVANARHTVRRLVRRLATGG